MTPRQNAFLVAAIGCAWLAAPQALAQQALAPSAEALPELGVEVDRDIATLTAEIRPRDVDVDYADTALVFTNLSGSPSKVLCAAFTGNGRLVGHAWLRLPKLGVRYMLASDIARDVDLIGHAQCATEQAVKGTAIFLGPGLTDLPVMQVTGNFGRMVFPLVATY